MEIDMMTGASSWAEASRLARTLQDAGFSGLCFTETSQVPWMQIAAAATEAEQDPDKVTSAPTTTPVGRMDEGKAARELNVCCPVALGDGGED